MKRLIEAEAAYAAIRKIWNETETSCRDYLDAVDCAENPEPGLIDADALIDEIAKIGEEKEIGSADYVEAIDSLAKKRGGSSLSNRSRSTSISTDRR